MLPFLAIHKVHCQEFDFGAVPFSGMDSSGADPDLLIFGPDDSMLDQVKNTLGFENLSQDWDAYLDPPTQPMQEHQLSNLEVRQFSHMVSRFQLLPAIERFLHC